MMEILAAVVWAIFIWGPEASGATSYPNDLRGFYDFPVTIR